jgi:P pilus assembly chaperone PapD
MEQKLRRIPRRSGFSRWRGIVFSLILLFAVDAAANVLISPTVVFISAKRRTGRMTVQNSTDRPKEISVHFSFGLPESDSLGNVRVFLTDSAVTDSRSALGWIKAFPRKMILPPNASQVIRLVASPPNDLPDGEYWCRVVIRSQDAQTEVPTSAEEGAITTQLNMIMQTAIMLKYRKGDLYSHIEITDTEVSMEEGHVDVVVDMASKGNASYVGMLRGRLLDADNKEISTQEVQLAVYYELRRRLEFPLVEGSYKRPFKVELSIDTEGRNDIADEDMLPSNEASYSQTIQ